MRASSAYAATIFAAVLGPALIAQAVSTDEEAAAIAAVTSLFQAQPTLIPQAVRLAFHDCFESGCDGCVDTSKAEHRGLETIISALDESLASVGHSMSRADFWALASTTAIEVAAESQNDPGGGRGGKRRRRRRRKGRGRVLDDMDAPLSPKIVEDAPEQIENGEGRVHERRLPKGRPGGGGGRPPPGGGGTGGGGRPPPPEGGPPPPGDTGNLDPDFMLQYGRTDANCSANLPVDRVMPDKHGGLELVAQVAAAIGVSERQAVALIGGGHSLGGCETANTGFSGDWTRAPTRFDTTYFRVLRDVNWRQRQVNRGQNFQWRGRGRGAGGLMLNVDMSMVFDLDLEDSGRDSSNCRRGSRRCSRSATAGIVDDFINDSNEFMDEFESAWEALLSMGASDLGPAV